MMPVDRGNADPAELDGGTGDPEPPGPTPAIESDGGKAEPSADASLDTSPDPTIPPQTPASVPREPFNVALSDARLHEYRFLPSVTDPLVQLADEAELAFVDTRAPLQQRLVVFLVGSNNAPDAFPLMYRHLASLGFHVIVPDYFNAWAPGQHHGVCDAGDGDPGCHDKYRREVFDGQDRSAHVSVSRADSLQGRVDAMLRHLARADPSRGWGHFLSVADSAMWERMIVAGISNGASMAAHLAVDHPVHRALLFSGPSDNVNGAIASWATRRKATSIDRIVSFVHADDPSHATHQAFLDAYGLTGEHNVDNSSAPYGGSRRLVSDRFVGSGQWDAHVAVVADRRSPTETDGRWSYAPVWRYMLDVLDTRASTMASFTPDYSAPTPQGGWSYLWNPNGDFTQTDRFAPLRFNGELFDSDGQAGLPDSSELHHGNINLLNGRGRINAGLGTGDGAASDRGAIVAFEVPETGRYQLRNAVLEHNNGGGTSNGVVFWLLVGQHVVRSTVLSATQSTNFSYDLGDLERGTRIYMGLGPNGQAGFDGCYLNVDIVRIRGV